MEGVLRWGKRGRCMVVDVRQGKRKRGKIESEVEVRDCKCIFVFLTTYGFV